MIQPKVLFTQRKYHGGAMCDTIFGILFLLNTLALIGACGYAIGGASKIQVTSNISFTGYDLGNTVEYQAQIDTCCASLINGSGCRDMQIIIPNSEQSTIWVQFARFPEIPAVIICIVPIVAILWLLFLERQTTMAVWGTLAFQFAVLISISIFFFTNNGIEPGAVFAGLAGILLITSILARAKIANSIEHLKMAALAIRKNPTLIPVALILKGAYMAILVLYWAGATKLNLHFVVNPIDCTSVPAPYVANISGWMGFSLLWVTFFTNSARLITTAMTIGSWFFNQSDRPSNVALSSVKIAVTKSFGTNAVGGLITAITQTILDHINSTYSWFTPWGWFFKLLGCCIHSCIQTLTRFATISHAFTGKGLFDSASLAFGVLRRNFVGAFVNDWVGTAVVKSGAWLFSLALGFIAWAWIDSVNGWTTLSLVSTNPFPDVIYYLFLVMYALLSRWPMLSILMIVAITSMPFFTIVDQLTAPFVALFVASVAHIIFGFFGAIILDAMNTIFFAYAISKDTQHPRTGREEYYKILDDLPEAKVVPASDLTGVVVAKAAY